MSDLETARVIALNLLRSQDLPDEAGVRRTAEIAIQALKAQAPESQVDVDSLTRELEANLNVVVGQASTLTDEESDHVPWFAGRRASIEWGFTRRYQRFLEEQKGWALATLQRSNDLTDRILELMEDPGRPGSWDRRGMVVGEVQSGKTSNYIELVCKAADAGYKFIVILTGTTNSLRAQTQLRFDEGFLGWDTRLNLALDSSNKRVGVGTLLGERLHRAIPSTNAEETGDFNLRVANQFNVRLGGDPVIMVVKKNASVLRNLTRWAKSLSPMDPNDAIPDIPTLVIDDEADFASVNTRPVGTGDDEDPTVINGRIRELLNAFEKKVYVGYTATPFANIFIYPDQDAARYGRDLFPRDFLINLPVPSNHVGPTKVFGLPEDPDDDMGAITPLPLFRRVDDHEEHIPSVHRSHWTVDELPDSLTRAIRAFVLTCAARAARGTGGTAQFNAHSRDQVRQRSESGRRTGQFRVEGSPEPDQVRRRWFVNTNFGRVALHVAGGFRANIQWRAGACIPTLRWDVRPSRGSPCAPGWWNLPRRFRSRSSTGRPGMLWIIGTTPRD